MNFAQENLIAIKDRISNILQELNSVNSGESSLLEEGQQDIVNLECELSDLFQAKSFQQKILTDEFKSKMNELVGSHPKKAKFKDYRVSNITFKNGTTIKIVSPYYILKGVGKKKNKGLFPALHLLGIYKHCSGNLCSYVSQLCSALSSYDEAQKMLKVSGIDLNIKTIIAISRQMALQVRLAQKAENYVVTFNDCGKTIVVSIDGGRVKTREKKKGPKTKKKRNRFKGQWREVKLFVVYLVDENGNKLKQQLPIIDGLIGSPETVFNLLKQYLTNIGLTSFEHIVFIADGAPWIWNRAKAMLMSLNLGKVEITEILDYFHAIEHLHKLAKMVHKKPLKQKQWVKACKGLLMNGKVEGFIKKLKTDTKGFRGKKVTVERNYFINNQARLGYKVATDMGLPLGSGAIESSIRRVVNLRLKGNSIFWKPESANDMLLLRSFYKAGRWSDLEKMAYHGGVQIAA